MDKEVNEELEAEKKKLEAENKAYEKELAKMKEKRKKLQEKMAKDIKEEKDKIDSIISSNKPDRKSTKIDLQLTMPVLSRLKKRVKEIQKLSQAKNEKVPFGNTYQWVTTPPKMHIAALHPQYNNGVGTISYYIYEMDDKGNKKGYKQYADVEMADGTTKRIIHTVMYKLKTLVVETIELNKALKIEEFDHDSFTTNLA